MNQWQYVFSQLMSLVSHRSFHTCVQRYKGDYKTKHFSCWNQFLCMAFGQLTHRESLSDTIVCLSANSQKLFHLGVGAAVSKSTLSKANENRNWKIYADLAQVLIKQAQKLYLGDDLPEIGVTGNVFAIDASTIDLCLSSFWWATFRSTKAGIKIHAQLDLKTSIPEFVHVTTASVHELNILDILKYEPGSFYVMDRGYIDFDRFYNIHTANAFFITRARNDFSFKRIKSMPCDKLLGIQCDQVVTLKSFYVKKAYPIPLRRIKFYDVQQQKVLVFLTNNFQLDASDIAQLYKHRWKVELFFKWIKQHLKIKSFWGKSENAVKTQIWIAIAIYVLVAIAKKRLKLQQSLYEILQVISISIFEKTPIDQLFAKPIQQNFKELNDNQLKLF